MTTYRTREAYEYYAEHILAPLEAKAPTYEEHNLSMEGLVPFRDWEAFIAVLVDDRGTGQAAGSDLQQHEVKSVRGRGGLEYQYHRRTGLEKLEHDRSLTHVLIAYDNHYRDLDVYVLPRERFAEMTERKGWRDRVWSAYFDPDGPTRQRCRLGISFAEVQSEGEHIMRIRDGRLVSL